MALEFHAELGEGAAAYHGDMLVEAGTHQGGGGHQAVDGAAAEGFYVGPGGVGAVAGLGYGFGKVAATTLIAVADGFLATVNHVVDAGGVDLLVVQQGAQGCDGGGFAGQVFQQDVGCQGGVFGVAGDYGANHAAIAEVEG